MRWDRRTLMAAAGGLALATRFGIDPVRAQVSSMAQTSGAAGTLRIVARFQQDAVFHLAWSPDGRFLAAASGGALGYSVWDIRAGRKIRELRDPYGPYAGKGSLAFTPDSKHLIVLPRAVLNVSGKRIAFALWNIETGAIDRQIEAPFIGEPPSYSSVMHLAASIPAGRLAVVYDGRNAPRGVVLYDTRTWQSLNARVPVPTAVSPPPAFAFSRGGEFIAMGGERTGEYRGEPRGLVWIYDANTGTLKHLIEHAHAQSVGHIKFSGDGKALASTPRPGVVKERNVLTKQLEELREDDPIRMWSTNGGERLTSIVGDFSGSYCLDFSPAGTLLVAANASRSQAASSPFRIWNARSSQLIATFGNFSGRGPLSASFSPDGKYLAVSGANDDGPEFVFVTDVSEL